jgi:hypothetical protein
MKRLTGKCGILVVALAVAASAGAAFADGPAGRVAEFEAAAKGYQAKVKVLEGRKAGS